MKSFRAFLPGGMLYAASRRKIFLKALIPKNGSSYAGW
jgi:hypothetical protein